MKNAKVGGVKGGCGRCGNELFVDVAAEVNVHDGNKEVPRGKE